VNKLKVDAVAWGGTPSQIKALPKMQNFLRFLRLFAAISMSSIFNRTLHRNWPFRLNGFLPAASLKERHELGRAQFRFVRWEDDGSTDQKKLAVSMQKRTADERRWTQILRRRKSGFSVLLAGHHSVVHSRNRTRFIFALSYLRLSASICGSNCMVPD
jgi:hypothetical protein